MFSGSGGRLLTTPLLATSLCLQPTPHYTTVHISAATVVEQVEQLGVAMINFPANFTLFVTRKQRWHGGGPGRCQRSSYTSAGGNGSCWVINLHVFRCVLSTNCLSSTTVAFSLGVPHPPSCQLYSCVYWIARLKWESFIIPTWPGLDNKKQRVSVTLHKLLPFIASAVGAMP